MITLWCYFNVIATEIDICVVRVFTINTGDIPYIGYGAICYRKKVPVIEMVNIVNNADIE